MSQIHAVVITASDACSHGEREDASGELLVQLLTEVGAQIVAKEILSDDLKPLADKLRVATLASEAARCSGGSSTVSSSACSHRVSHSKPDVYTIAIDGIALFRQDDSASRFRTIGQWSLLASTGRSGTSS